MRSLIQVAVLTLAAFAALVAQTPQGWKMRVDRSTEATGPDAAGDIKFVTVGSGFLLRIPERRCTGIRRARRRAPIHSRALLL
jgi:hypothetical protein